MGVYFVVRVYIGKREVGHFCKKGVHYSERGFILQLELISVKQGCSLWEKVFILQRGCSFRKEEVVYFAERVIIWKEWSSL